MSTISRPVKTGGNTTYTDEVAGGNTHIKAVEVDADFDTIYTDYNGNITNANIAPAANIATAKLAQDGGIQTGHLADNSVTGAKIVDGTITDVDLAPDSVTTAKILDGAVTTDKIVDGAVTTSKILDGNVTLAKMAAGSSVRHGEAVEGGPSGAISAEEDILTFTTFTPNGAASIISIHTTIHYSLLTVSAGSITVRTRIYRNAVTVVKEHTQTISMAAATTVPFTVSFHAIQGLLITAQDFTVTAEVTASSGSPPSATVIKAFGSLVEHA